MSEAEPSTAGVSGGRDHGMEWQCFIDYREAMYHVPCLALTAEQAAVDAARTTGIPGIWTVVRGEAIEVNISEKSVFEVANVISAHL